MAYPGPFTSVEVRWFFPGGTAANAGLAEWFVDTQPVPREPETERPRWQPRSDGKPDVYLRLPGVHDMGIKLREGLLQIKGRVAELGPVGFGGGRAGIVDCWCKWSYADALPALETVFRPAAAGSATIPVAKTRALRLFVLSGGDDLREMRPGCAVDRGVMAELAELTVAGRAFVSLAFEAFPDDAAMRAVFPDVVSRCLADCPDHRLDASTSASYPRLLDRLGTDRAPGQR